VLNGGFSDLTRLLNTFASFTAKISDRNSSGKILTHNFSGTAASRQCSFAPASASPSVSSSPSSSSSDAHGPHSSVSDSVLEGRGKSVTT
jgi:hypothetical protein